MHEVSNLTQQKVTGLLVSIGFAYEDQQIKIEDLSQGQRARLNLLALRLLEPNFYIMDEPTNHLDIAGQEALEREITDHGAASILVSHDRAFVTNLGTKFFQINKGQLQEIETPEIFFKLSSEKDPKATGKNLTRQEPS